MASDIPKGRGEHGRRRNSHGDYVTKLTPEVVDKICGAIEKGVTFDGAAQYGGITRDTFYRWLRMGRADDAPAPLAEFASRVDYALAVWEVNAVTAIHGAEAWQGQAWLLERRKPDDYGRRLRVEDDGGGDPRAPSLARALLKHGLDSSRLDHDQLETLIGLFQIMQIDEPTGPRPIGPGPRAIGPGDHDVIEQVA